MSDNEDTPEETPAQDIDPQEISSARMVTQTIAKAAKAFRMYLPNNPLLKRFIGEFKEAMTDHLEGYGTLRLDVDQFQFRFMGNAVYENRSTKDSLAFRAYSNGIKALIFSEGLEEREMEEFLDIICKDLPDYSDDDIVTRLWEKDLPHVRYLDTEDKSEPGSSELGLRAITPDEQKAAIRGAYKDISQARPLPVLANPPQRILFLDEDEIAWIRRARELEERRDPTEEVIDILTSILSVEKDMKLFEEFVGITVDLIRNLIHLGEIRYAIILIRFLNELSQNEMLPSDQKKMLLKAKEGLLTEDAAGDLHLIIDGSDKISPGDLKGIVSMLGKSAIRPLCSLLGVVEKRKMREIIIAGLVSAGKDSPEEFFPVLSDRRWYLVRNAVIILKNIGSLEAAPHIGSLVSHGDKRVRKEALLYLQTIPDAEAKRPLLEFLKDEDQSLRVQAVKALAGTGFRDALGPIMSIAASKDFEARDLSEKRVVFESIGQLGGDQVVSMFRDMLMRKYLLNKTKEREAVSCAVAGLRKVRSKAALSVLNEAVAVKKGDAGDMIGQAIKSLSGEDVKNPPEDIRGDNG